MVRHVVASTGEQDAQWWRRWSANSVTRAPLTRCEIFSFQQVTVLKLVCDLQAAVGCRQGASTLRVCVLRAALTIVLQEQARYTPPPPPAFPRGADSLERLSWRALARAGAARLRDCSDWTPLLYLPA